MARGKTSRMSEFLKPDAKGDTVWVLEVSGSPKVFTRTQCESSEMFESLKADIKRRETSLRKCSSSYWQIQRDVSIVLESVQVLEKICREAVWECWIFLAEFST